MPPPLAAPLQVLVERGEVVVSHGQLPIEHKKNVHIYLKAFWGGQGGYRGGYAGRHTRLCLSQRAGEWPLRAIQDHSYPAPGTPF